MCVCKKKKEKKSQYLVNLYSQYTRARTFENVLTSLGLVLTRLALQRTHSLENTFFRTYTLGHGRSRISPFPRANFPKRFVCDLSLEKNFFQGEIFFEVFLWGKFFFKGKVFFLKFFLFLIFSLNK